MALAVIVGWSALASAGITSVEINGKEYTDISAVYVGESGKIIIASSSITTAVKIDDVPTNFLDSWNINEQSRKAVREKNARIAAQELERAIASGRFRTIGGVVYDTRKPQSGWTRFQKAKVIQVLDDGAILDATPDERSYFAIHVKHLADTIGDTDVIGFTAKLIGNYSYINKKGDDRTIRDYDAAVLVVVCVVSWVAALVLGGLWIRGYRSKKSIIKIIKNRLPPEGTQIRP